MRKLIKISFLIIGIVMLLLTVSSQFIPTHNINSGYIVRGNYDENLNSIQDVNQLKKAIDASIKIDLDTAQYAEAGHQVLSQRFYHGTLRYNLSDDYIAYLLGEFVWDDLRMVVLPNDLLKGNTVVCNQMAILFQYYLSEKNIRYRSVGIQSHLITEVWYDGDWHVFDPDYEAEIPHRHSMEKILSEEDGLKNIYLKTEGQFFNTHFQKLISSKNAVFGQKDEVLARNLQLFHVFTHFLSFFGWMIPFIISVFLNPR